MDKIGTIRSKFPDKVQNIQKPEIRSKMNDFERASEDYFEFIVKIM